MSAKPAEPVIYQSKLDWRPALLPLFIMLPQNMLMGFSLFDEPPHRGFYFMATLQLISVALLVLVLIATLKSEVILTETRLVYRSFQWWGWLGRTEIPLSKIQWLTLREGGYAGHGSVGVVWSSNDEGYRKQIGLPLAKPEHFRDLLQARLNMLQSGQPA